jgi:hypothetical protein
MPLSGPNREPESEADSEVEPAP